MSPGHFPAAPGCPRRGVRPMTWNHTDNRFRAQPPAPVPTGYFGGSGGRFSVFRPAVRTKRIASSRDIRIGVIFERAIMTV